MDKGRGREGEGVRERESERERERGGANRKMNQLTRVERHTSRSTSDSLEVKTRR